MTTLVAMFTNTQDADRAVEQLTGYGVAASDMSMLVAETASGQHFKVVEANKGAEGAVGGGLVGGALGALAAGLVAIGVIVVPGVGLLGVGPLLAALAGAGAGAAGGGLVGGLVGLGIPVHEAQVLNERVTRGGILLALDTRADDDLGTLRQLLSNAGATSISTVNG